MKTNTFNQGQYYTNYHSFTHSLTEDCCLTHKEQSKNYKQIKKIKEIQNKLKKKKVLHDVSLQRGF